MFFSCQKQKNVWSSFGNFTKIQGDEQQRSSSGEYSVQKNRFWKSFVARTLIMFQIDIGSFPFSQLDWSVWPIMKRNWMHARNFWKGLSFLKGIIHWDIDRSVIDTNISPLRHKNILLICPSSGAALPLRYYLLLYFLWNINELLK